jgi:hypothetical protein
VATSEIFVDRRGERNVPRRYLKDAEWYSDKYLGEGYYVADPDDDDRFCAVDFNFDTLQWGLTEPVEGQYRITRPIPVKYGLRIFDEERQDRSRWGPIDGTTENEEPLAQIFKFGSDQGDTPDPDIDISGNESREREERSLAALAQLIPTHITRPHFDSIDGLSSLAARMSQIAATTTLTSTSTLGRTTGAGIPSGAGSGSANILRNFLGGGGRFGGGPPHGTGPPGSGGPADGGDPPNPPGDPTGDPAGDPGAGGGGDPANVGGRGNPPDGRLSDKLIGREPEIYDGERAKVENFLTEWNVYRALNDQTRVMATALERTMLFLTFIRGPKVGNWVNDQVKTVGKYIRQGGHKTDEFIWDTVIDEFANTFQDIMSHERAENELNHLRMEGGNLDIYSAEFKRLARLAEYNLEERLVGRKYFDGLPEGLRRAIVKDENMGLLISVADYEDAAIRYHRKFLQVQAFFDKSGKNKKPTRQQWQQRFVKDPNAMDLTPGRTRARAALTDDEMNKLRQEGKCFKCKRQGHIRRNCPNQNSQIRATNSGGPQIHPATNTSTASSGAITSPISIRKAITAQELVDLVRDMDQGEKDKVIQDIFMQEDFAAALT